MRSNRSLIHLDDDPSFTRLVAERLGRHGFNVQSIHDPAEFLARLPSLSERLVLLDFDMPGIDGLHVLREIKGYDGGILVVMLTGIVTSTTVLQSYQLGAEACVFKPVVDWEPLRGALDDAFHKIDRWWDALTELLRRQRQENYVMRQAMAGSAGGVPDPLMEPFCDE